MLDHTVEACDPASLPPLEQVTSVDSLGEAGGRRQVEGRRGSWRDLRVMQLTTSTVFAASNIRVVHTHTHTHTRQLAHTDQAGGKICRCTNMVSTELGNQFGSDQFPSKQYSLISIDINFRLFSSI